MAPKQFFNNYTVDIETVGLVKYLNYLLNFKALSVGKYHKKMDGKLAIDIDVETPLNPFSQGKKTVFVITRLYDN